MELSTRRPKKRIGADTVMQILLEILIQRNQRLDTYIHLIYFFYLNRLNINFVPVFSHKLPKTGVQKIEIKTLSIKQKKNSNNSIGVTGFLKNVNGSVCYTFYINIPLAGMQLVLKGIRHTASRLNIGSSVFFIK